MKLRNKTMTVLAVSAIGASGSRLLVARWRTRERPHDAKQRQAYGKNCQGRAEACQRPKGHAVLPSVVAMANVAKGTTGRRPARLRRRSTPRNRGHHVKRVLAGGKAF